MRETLAKLLALTTLCLLLGVALLYGVRQEARMGALASSIDPAEWAERYPQHHASFMRTAENYGRTAHGGSEPYDKLAANPFRARAWAGNAFALDYKAARGHFYALSDQRQSRRTREREQPAGCINCHAAEAPALIAELGWQELHALPYDAVQAGLQHGSSCADCHAPDTMALRITRPALLNALQTQGIDAASLSRQDLRSYVCAQCHVEYYFRSGSNELVLPWREGRRIEDIERYYDSSGHVDWIHAETGAPLLKAQHPESELHGTGIHATLGLACADCHMPPVQEAGLRISDHWLRSPLTQVEAACMRCHGRDSPDSLRARVVVIQDNTVALLRETETALGALMDSIVAAREAGANESVLATARQAQRSAQLRWDFIDAENSTGFHSSLEAQRILTDAIRIAVEGLVQ